MLKTINPILTGDLLSILADMGHGDEIVITDGNFPASAVAQDLVQLPGIPATDALAAILSLLPLDDFVDVPAAAMDAPGDRPPVYAEFERLIAEAEGRPIPLDFIPVSTFYERAKAAFAVVSSGDRRLYANVILRKGVLRSPS
jgi:L-fucose mutarotase